MTNPKLDFFVRASMSAKRQRIAEINQIETQLILLEDDLKNFRLKGLPITELFEIENKIYDMKKLIKEKKSKIL